MNTLALIAAIIAVESSGNPKAFNRAEDARGPMQIRPCVVQDVNQFTHKSWTHEDAWKRAPSVSMFLTYTGLWCKRLDYAPTPENRARIWNGGPYGPRRESTLKYWKRVKAKMEL